MGNLVRVNEDHLLKAIQHEGYGCISEAVAEVVNSEIDKKKISAIEKERRKKEADQKKNKNKNKQGRSSETSKEKDTEKSNNRRKVKKLDLSNIHKRDDSGKGNDNIDQ